MCVYLKKLLVNVNFKTFTSIFFQFSEEDLEELWIKIPQLTFPKKFSVNIASR